MEPLHKWDLDNKFCVDCGVGRTEVWRTHAECTVYKNDWATASVKTEEVPVIENNKDNKSYWKSDESDSN